MSAEPMTSRACVVCGWIFHVGFGRAEAVGEKIVRTRSLLDTHCGKPTRECPTFDPDGFPPNKETGFPGTTAFEERHKAYRDYFTGRAGGDPQPESVDWWK